MVSTDTSDGGNDLITYGAGRAIVLGGQGDDTITGGAGTAIVLGDSGMILAASSDTDRFGTLRRRSASTGDRQSVHSAQRAVCGAAGCDRLRRAA